jgi:hypothetical protein
VRQRKVRIRIISVDDEIANAPTDTQESGTFSTIEFGKVNGDSKLPFTMRFCPTAERPNRQQMVKLASVLVMVFLFRFFSFVYKWLPLVAASHSRFYRPQ